MLAALPSFPLNRIKRSINGRYFAVDVCGSMGMGGMLTHLVKILSYADQNELLPVIAFTNPLYANSPKSDWFNEYFEMNADYSIDPKVKSELTFLKVFNQHSLTGLSVPKRMSLSEANRIFFKYVKIKPVVHDLVENLMRGMNDRLYDVSIHFRGTDKHREAAPVGYDEVAEKLESLVQSGLRLRSAFLATDEQLFRVYITRRFPHIQFSSFDYGEDISGTKPRHFSSMPGESKAIEALVNIVAISKSAECIRTCSYLSAWSKILNPDLITYTLNRPNRTEGSFPELEILDAEAFTRDRSIC
jgi:hypothetical protein